MINFRLATFIKSATKQSERPEKKLDEILFIGRSNVGKSSLINALCDNKSLCFTSSKPGHTRLLNYFEIKDQCYLVDAPGYGYSKAGKSHDLLFANMMEDYFADNNYLKLVVFLIDSRREIREDENEMFDILNTDEIPYIVAMTKCDKLNQSERHKMKQEIAKFSDLIKADNVIFTSINNKKSIEELKKKISDYIN